MLTNTFSSIILILSFLLFYKLFDYIADFKTIKHKSRIEIIFLVAFFVILFIPLSNISQEKTSNSENRTLAIYKPFINKKGEINYNFGKNYDKYFNQGDKERNTLTEFNSNNTELLSVEETKAKIAALTYIQEELKKDGRE